MESNLFKGTGAIKADSLRGASPKEDISEYVAHLQLHMALQARNLVPNLKHPVSDSRTELLHQTQANFEKQISRQTL